MATQALFLTFRARPTLIIFRVNQNKLREYRNDEILIKFEMSWFMTNLVDAWDP